MTKCAIYLLLSRGTESTTSAPAGMGKHHGKPAGHIMHGNNLLYYYII